jgi:hypothetical protein
MSTKHGTTVYGVEWEEQQMYGIVTRREEFTTQEDLEIFLKHLRRKHILVGIVGCYVTESDGLC